jgi:hypothetical protein
MCICKDDGNKGHRYKVKVVSKINHKGLSEQTILQRVNSGLTEKLTNGKMVKDNLQLFFVQDNEMEETPMLELQVEKSGQNDGCVSS